jgi:glutamate-1-semialdehyde 2,1-aminomutase
MTPTPTPDRGTAESRRLFADARGVMPGGVNSPVRAFGSVGGDPLFIASAAGATLTDADGNAYLDYVGSWGPMILGHAHPVILDAVSKTLPLGTSFGAPTATEVDLAELVVDMVPSIEIVRFVNSGTEATMSAVRLARAATGRSKVIKFRGGYHGHADVFLVEAGSGAATLGVPSSPGVPSAVVADTLVAEYNDLESVDALLATVATEVACIIVEPVAGNMGCVPPDEGFLDGLRSRCDRTGALLIFDEVMTGFRVAPGGAQERFGVTPDLTTLGKVIGGGLPVGAYGGRADLMRQVAPDGPVYQAGTLSGNPLAMAAGLATLRYLQSHPDCYAALERLGARFDAGWATLRKEGYAITWNRVGSMGSLFFTATSVTDWHSAAASDGAAFSRYFNGMLHRGIYLAPSPFEALFLSAAHTESDIDRTLEAARAVLQEVY